MKNIHILPTDKPSSLYILGNNELKLRYTIDLPIDPDIAVNLHIYITSDEEIKESDWFYNTISLKPEPFKACENGDGYVNCSKYSHYRIDCKKIILTTDQSLIQDGVQAIDDEFLEWFVKNPSCEEVGVKLKQHFQADKLKRENLLNGVYHSYKIIIPKEEPKQETLEEAAERYWAKQPYNEDAFMEGAKWQEERMYSEEDMAESFMACWKANVPEGFECKLSFKEWFEQFKKK